MPLFEGDAEGPQAATEVALCELMQSGVTTLGDLSAARCRLGAFSASRGERIGYHDSRSLGSAGSWFGSHAGRLDGGISNLHAG
jgi:hypothetical protein